METFKNYLRIPSEMPGVWSRAGIVGGEGGGDVGGVCMRVLVMVWNRYGDPLGLIVFMLCNKFSRRRRLYQRRLCQRLHEAVSR